MPNRQLTFLGTAPDMLRKNFMHLWPKSAVGSNIRGQPPSMTVIPWAGERGPFGQAGQHLIGGEVERDLVRIAAARAPEPFVCRHELRVQLADDLVLVAEPVVQVPRADPRLRGNVVGADRGGAALVEQLQSGAQNPVARSPGSVCGRCSQHS